MVILECNKITKSFGGLIALDNVSFSVEEGELLGLIGPNGAGKTTLFNVIAGLYRPTSGEIKFKGKTITKAAPHQICKKGIARTFQIPQPFKGLTVLENVMVGSFFGNLKGMKKKKSLKIVDFIGLISQKDTLVENLTIADQKKVEIAKALATNPDLLLLDEVAAGLNPAEQDELANLVKEIQNKLDVTIIMVEHIMKAVMGLSSRVIVLDRGHILKEGDPQSIGKDKQVIEVYLGEEYVEYTQC